MNNRWYTVLIAAFIAGCQSLEVREEKTGHFEPYGLWKCTIVSAYRCRLYSDLQPGWNKVKPDCEPFDEWDDDETTIYFDLRTSDYTFSIWDAPPEPMKCIGNESGEWMVASDYGFSSGYIDPETKRWLAHFGIMQSFFGHNYWEGTCEDITDQPPEKPTEAKD